MECHHLVFVIVFSFIFIPVQSKQKEDEIDLSKFAEIASSLLKDQNAESIGGLINSFMQSDTGKTIGDALLNTGNQNNVNQILQGVSSMLSPGEEGKKNKGFDPSLLATVLNVMNNINTDNDNNINNNNNKDSSGVLSMFGDIVQQEGGLEAFLQFLPLISSTINSFTGEEAKQREEKHAEHSGALPPFLEQLHVAYDHFMNSDLAKEILKALGSEKFVKVFSDSNGNFSFEKFVESLENLSFRKHWIQMVTKRIAEFIAYFADPVTQKRFSTTAHYFVNSFLKSYGFPKSAMYDPLRPSETLTAIINYFFKTYFNYKLDSKQYVNPAVKYVQEVINISKQNGYFSGRGIDSSNLSSKLTDTINLEIIEPGARVYRAYRFAKKHPKCDRYVMCLINQPEANEQLSLPGLKRGLSMSGSLVASWFLTRNTETTFISLFNIITTESKCKAHYVDSCSGFHKEELKVTTEYVHNEL